MRRNKWLILAIAVLMVLALLVIAAPVEGANPPPGNNGTVKIHEGNSEAEPIVKNEPHVCTFHIHFFFADPHQSGSWEVKSWPPTGNGDKVQDGKYDTSPSGEYRTQVYSLADGHYRLEWQGRNDQNIKHKEFWVECPKPPTVTRTNTPVPPPTATRTATRANTKPPPPTKPPTASSTPSPSRTPTTPATSTQNPTGTVPVTGTLVATATTAPTSTDVPGATATLQPPPPQPPPPPVVVPGPTGTPPPQPTGTKGGVGFDLGRFLLWLWEKFSSLLTVPSQ